MAGELKAVVAVTDRDWFQSLSAIPDLDEVNFWQPNATPFAFLVPGEPLLFKLHSPLNFIVGGGFFAHGTRLPISIAWEAFGNRNGAADLNDMRRRTERYRRTTSSPTEDYQVGRILLEQPFFLTVTIGWQSQTGCRTGAQTSNGLRRTTLGNRLLRGSGKKWSYGWPLGMQPPRRKPLFLKRQPGTEGPR